MNKQEDKEGDDLSSYITLSISKIEVLETSVNLELLLMNSSDENIQVSREGRKLEQALAGTISIGGQNFIMENYTFPTIINGNSSVRFKYSCSRSELFKEDLVADIFIGIMAWKKNGGEWKEREEGWVLRASKKATATVFEIND